jgi:hypothetical protein
MSRLFSTVAKVTKPPRVLRLLTNFGGDALKINVTKGNYNKPMVPVRIAAVFRKKAIIEGTFGSFVPNEGGWDPAWDVPRKIVPLRPHKGHLRERNRHERFQKVQNAMKAMPDKIAKYESEVKARKPVKDIFYQFKRVAAMANKKGGMNGPTGGVPTKNVTGKKKVTKKGK